MYQNMVSYSVVVCMDYTRNRRKEKRIHAILGKSKRFNMNPMI